nr:60S ribosomal protein L10-like [Macaca nemestrina]
MGAQCTIAADSSFLGSICSLFLVWAALRDLGDRPFRWMFMSLTLHYSQCRLQIGIRGAFGKPEGAVARVHIGQVIMPIRTNLQNKEHVTEALCRAKFKFPGHQNIHFSKKWDFTKFNVDEFEDMMAEKQLIPDSCGIKYTPNPDPLDKWWALHS